MQKLCISYESNGSKNDSALSIDKIFDAQHAAIIEYRKDRGPKSMGPEPLDQNKVDALLARWMLNEDIYLNIYKEILIGSFVRAHESTQSVHLSSWWHDISNDRMSKNKATDPPDPTKTSSKKKQENDIKGMELNRSIAVTHNIDVIIHVIVRGKAPTISNRFTYNKTNFTPEILENVAIRGSTDSAIIIMNFKKTEGHMENVTFLLRGGDYFELQEFIRSPRHVLEPKNFLKDLKLIIKVI